MRRRSTMFAYIIFGLIAIGLLANLLTRPSTMLIPLLVLGIVFYLYKFPPGRSRRGGHRSGQTTKRDNKASKRATFRVIRGNKRDDDEPPRYH